MCVGAAFNFPRDWPRNKFKRGGQWCVRADNGGHIKSMARRRLRQPLQSPPAQQPVKSYSHHGGAQEGASGGRGRVGGDLSASQRRIQGRFGQYIVAATLGPPTSAVEKNRVHRGTSCAHTFDHLLLRPCPAASASHWQNHSCPGIICIDYWQKFIIE
jgi:hypothetical protein